MLVESSAMLPREPCKFLAVAKIYLNNLAGIPIIHKVLKPYI